MLSFKSLGSGSSGNATLVEASGLWPCRLLVDCGLGVRALTQRLASAGWGAQDLDAIFITHEHGDHVGCASALASRHGLPIWMSEGTWRGCGQPDLGDLLHITADGDRIDLGAMELRPFAVPHDALEPLQLRCSDGQRSLGILTDLGHEPASVLHHLQGCQALLLECNHDPDMLNGSAYPHFLKRRVGGELGHLSNEQSAGIAEQLKPKLRRVLAGHLSRQNNRPELAEAALRQVLGDGAEIDVADALTGSGWLRV